MTDKTTTQTAVQQTLFDNLADVSDKKLENSTFDTQAEFSNKQDSSRLAQAKRKLERLEQEVNLAIDDLFAHQKLTNGQPMNDKRNGHTWFKARDQKENKFRQLQQETAEQRERVEMLEARAERQMLGLNVSGNGLEMSVRNIIRIEAEIEKGNRQESQYSKATIDGYKKRLVELKAIQARSELANTNMSPRFQSLIDAGRITQWSKQPTIYFIKGIRKVALEITAEGKLEVALKYPPKTDEEKEIVKELLSMANQENEINRSAPKMQDVPKHYIQVEFNESNSILNIPSFKGQIITEALVDQLQNLENRITIGNEGYFKFYFDEIQNGEIINHERMDLGAGLTANQEFYDWLKIHAVTAEEAELLQQSSKSIDELSIEAVIENESAENISFDFEKLVKEVFNQRAEGELGKLWTAFKTDDGVFDLNEAFQCFVDDVRSYQQVTIPYELAKGSVFLHSQMSNAYMDTYYAYFYQGGEAAFDAAVNQGKSLAYTESSIQQFTELFDQHVEKMNQASMPVADEALKEIIGKKDYKALTKHLKEGVKGYLNSNQFKRYLNFVSKFHRYSSNNVRLILGQNPQASRVAGFNKWKEMERFVQKGSKAIYIYAPSKVIEKDSNGKPVLDQNGEVVKKTIFFLTPVFDISQTEGKLVPKLLYELENNFDDPEFFAKMYQGLSHISPVPIKIENIEMGANGYYDRGQTEIVLKKGMGQEMTIKTLIHEMTHAQLHANSQAKFGSPEYSKHEFEAESVAYIVSNHLGFDTSGYSFGYLANWTKEGRTIDDFTESLETITKTAQDMINQLEQTLNKVYGKTAPQNKFEERIEAAISQKQTAQKAPTKDKNLSTRPKV
jgi:hypothetical protein